MAKECNHEHRQGGSCVRGVHGPAEPAAGPFRQPLWLWFTAFIGLNMLQSAFTGFCPAAMIFRKLGLKPGNAF